MHESVNMATVGFLPVLMGGTSGGAGGTGVGSSWMTSVAATADFTQGFLDRTRTGRLYHSAKAVIPWTASLGVGARLVANVAIQDAPDSTGGPLGWADVAGSIIGSTGTRRQVVQGPTVTSSAGWTGGCFHADFNIMPARRYVRLAWNLDMQAATSSGQSVQFLTPLLLLGGPENFPVDSNFRACST